jgi:hypothetical protein
LKSIKEKRETPVKGSYDVIVAGGGPAGIGAAVSAARNGAKTLVIERYGCFGGIGTSGLHPHMNQMNAARSAGMSEEKSNTSDREERLLRDGGTGFILGGIPMEICTKAEQGFGHVRDGVLDYELECMKRLYDDLVLDSGCDILFNTVLADVITEDNSVTAVIVENKTGRTAYQCSTLIDCTGDGDAAAKAGASFMFGRENDGKVQPVTLMFRIGGCDTATVKHYQDIHGWRLKHVWVKAVENGDMQPFNVHVCGFWYLDVRPQQIGVNFTNIPNIDGTNADDVTRALIEGRRQAEITLKVMRKYIPGCENAYMIDTAPMLGVRETRRVKGRYVLTVDDVIKTRKFPDAIARGSFKVDIHTPGGAGQADGRYLPKGSYYDIPYRTLVPEAVEGLLVAGRCISATHEALGSTRVMFQCMALGEAAGTAAALCARRKIKVSEIDIDELKQTLRDNGALN